CPSCGRADVDLVKLAKEVEHEFRGLKEEIHIAVMGCVPEGQSVVTRQGPKPIEAVSETDEVLTHAGEYRKVEWASTHAFDDGLGEIPVDEDFMTLAGYYLSEGTMSGKAGKPYQQFFYFHEDQRAYVERLQSILSGMGLASQVRRRRHTAEVVAHSLALGQLLKALFGHGATEKRMPDWMERLPHEKQRALVKAL